MDEDLGDPLKPKPEPEPEPEPGPPVPYIIYCYDRQRYIWNDAHGTCECHKRRFLHRD